MTVNKVTLVGNVGSVDSKGNVTRVSLATSNKFKNKQGEQVEETSWHRLVFFGKLCEIVDKYVSKGDKLYIEGSLKYGKYEGQDGIERYSTDIIVREMRMLGSPKSSNESSKQASTKAAPAEDGNYDNFDDEIPF